MKRLSTRPVVKNTGVTKKSNPRTSAGSGKPRGSMGIMSPKPSQRRKPPR